MSAPPSTIARHPRIRLGFLSHVAGNGAPEKILRETIDLFVLAEELGFASAWVAQHHIRAENGILPSPFVFLSAVAQHTKHIRLGTAVVMLPLEDPIRVAEDAAIADLLSGGRLEIGLGTGADLATYQTFGLDHENRRERHVFFRAQLEAMLSGSPPENGTHLHPHVPGLAERIWWATGNIDSAIEAGKAGKGLLLGRLAPNRLEGVGEVQFPLIQSYLENFRSSSATTPHIGVTRTIYPAESKSEAVRVLEEGTRRWSAQAMKDSGWEDASIDKIFLQNNIITGSSENIVASLLADRAVANCTDLLVQFQPGEPGFKEASRALRIVAEEIAPLLTYPADDVPLSHGRNGKEIKTHA